jgi:hypothetical protein
VRVDAAIATLTARPSFQAPESVRENSEIVSRHGFSRAAGAAKSMRLYSMLKNT